MENREAIDAALNGGTTGNRVSRDFGLSVASVYRHINGGHHKPGYVPSVLPEPPSDQPAPVSPTVPALDSSPERTAALREAKRLALEARRNVLAAKRDGDIKSINGAISSATKAQEHLADIRGVIRRGPNVAINNSVMTVQAMDAHAKAEAMSSHDLIDLAEAELAAHASAGSAHALAAIGRLVRLLPEAQAVEPQGDHNPHVA